ncbi:hypothetical protein [Streptomyces sp. NPDC058371]|uniref:hypothetical protein n=1 Tax=Streptomyces sp. NPDC058371 TaxID=3346463 RepID=UPI003657E0DD
MSVEHTKYGIGTVLEVQGAGPRAFVLVSFGAKRDIKRLHGCAGCWGCRLSLSCDVTWSHAA